MSEIKYRHNVMNINSLNTFLSIRGGCSNDIRDVYFVRGVGEVTGINQVIEKVDRQMELEMGNNRLKYCRLSNLPQLREVEDANYYSLVYDELVNKNILKMRKIEADEGLKNAILNAMQNTVGIYQNHKPATSPSMLKNFAVKLLYWLDSSLSAVLAGWNEKACIKVLADNVVKEQEYLFFLMLTFIGCDVFLVQNRVDVDASEDILKYSYMLKMGEKGDTQINAYVKKTSRKRTNPNMSGNSRKTGVITKKTSSGTDNLHNNLDEEKSLEELAQLASSVVLIAVCDAGGEVIGTGSGIMIGRKGFILTNNHVASGGRYYSVRIEDDDEVYNTKEVIKYNPATDLAVIRIQRTLNPIPIYDGRKKLVRGQKVVAIGSPLGLFNSVSDGIISGFRNINDVDMIQFTAPISHGSSGGAVLNMQGEVVGISTAGIDSGQNINLAVGYENIRMFTNGFTS